MAEPTNTQTQETNMQTAQQAVQVDYDKIQSMIDKGTAQKESAILKSYFEQQGMTEDEAKAAIDAYKQNKQSQSQKEKDDIANMQKENAELKAQILQSRIDATVSAKATELGIDAAKVQYAAKLADLKDGVNDKGEVDEAKVKAALEDVLKNVPEFKKAADGTASGGFQIGGKGGSSTEGANESLNKMRAIMGLKPLK